MCSIYGLAGELQTTAGRIQEAITGARAAVPLPQMAHPAPGRESQPPRAPLKATRGQIRPSKSGDSGLSGPEQRIVDAIAWFEAIGVQEPEQPGVAFMAQYTYGSGGYNNPRGSLNQKGMVRYLPGDHIALTDGGRAVARYPDIDPSDEALHEAVLGKLDGPMRRILEPLLAHYPHGYDNETLATKAGYAPDSGGYNNPRGKLKSLGLVEYRDKKVFARSILFPEKSR